MSVFRYLLLCSREIGATASEERVVASAFETSQIMGQDPSLPVLYSRTGDIFCSQIL